MQNLLVIIIVAIAVIYTVIAALQLFKKQRGCSGCSSTHCPSRNREK